MPVTGLLPPRRRTLWRAAVAVSLLAALLGALRSPLRGDEQQTAAPPLTAEIAVSARYSQEWTDGDTEIAILRGDCRIAQGDTLFTAQKMVVWRQRAENDRSPRDRLAVYLEDQARVQRPGQSSTEPSAFIFLATDAGLNWEVLRPVGEPPADDDALLQRADERRRSARRHALQQTQLIVPNEQAAGPELRSVQFQPPASDMRRVRIFPRSAVPFNVESRTSELTTPPEQVWIITGGVNVIVDGLEDFGTIDMAADRIVIWTRTADEFRSETVQTRDTPFTVYLEGNIVIRQGQNVVRASHATYDAREDRALLLNAELRAFIPQVNGNLRLRADRMRQLSDRHYHAQNAWVTTSEFGVPGYRLQASDVFFEYRASDPWIGGPSSVPRIDPLTGRPLANEVPWVTSLNNTLFVEEVPLLYVPRISGPVDNPQIPLKNVTVRQDSIFGTQIRTTWDAFQIFGVTEPQGVTWDLHLDYLSDRGPAAGTGGEYIGEGLFGIPGTYAGRGLGWYINDGGRDNLGRDRRNLEPETDDRYRATWEHRQNLPGQLTLWGEIGLLSDRNFLEQYFENEFDEAKDIETLIYGRQQYENYAWTALGRVQLNDFENTTEWLPRGDLYVLGEPLLGGWINYSSHSSAGYAQLRRGDAPDDPNDLFVPIPYIVDAEGAVLMTRHELNAPLNLGPLNITPYVLGEAAFWGDDFTGSSLDRFVGSAGLRSSLMFWRVFPYIQSRVFNLNGLAHKVTLEGDYYFTETTEPFSAIPQYNEIDDNSQERFRQRFPFNTFGGAVPPQFDPRFYGVRTGSGLWLTAPWHELVDDQQVLRLAMRQRWQTKVGPPERLRIKDWMTLDLEASFFPKEDRDNFGESFGLLGANYAWHFSERTSLLANAYYDLFDDAQQLWDIGLLSQRSLRGSFYLGLRQVKGATLDSQIVSASYSYKMSPKWVSTFGTAYDLGENRNAGQSLTLSRIGADFIVHLGASFDDSKDNASIGLSIEPRFGPFSGSTSPQLSSLLRPQ